MGGRGGGRNEGMDGGLELVWFGRYVWLVRYLTYGRYGRYDMEGMICVCS